MIGCRRVNATIVVRLALGEAGDASGGEESKGDPPTEPRPVLSEHEVAARLKLSGEKVSTYLLRDGEA